MKEVSTKKLLDTIIEGIRNRKGQRIVTIDLRKIKEAPVEMMVICEGQSNTQVASIADEIDDFRERGVDCDGLWHDICACDATRTPCFL